MGNDRRQMCVESILNGIQTRHLLLDYDIRLRVELTTTILETGKSYVGKGGGPFNDFTLLYFVFENILSL